MRWYEKGLLKKQRKQKKKRKIAERSSPLKEEREEAYRGDILNPEEEHMF
jgi:hypothetical protein